MQSYPQALPRLRRRSQSPHMQSYPQNTEYQMAPITIGCWWRKCHPQAVPRLQRHSQKSFMQSYPQAIPWIQQHTQKSFMQYPHLTRAASTQAPFSAYVKVFHAIPTGSSQAPTAYSKFLHARSTNSIMQITVMPRHNILKGLPAESHKQHPGSRPILK